MTLDWAPKSLSAENSNVPELINQCELMEMTSGLAAGKSCITVVELAALLYTGEYVHARHVWRRWKPEENDEESANNQNSNSPSEYQALLQDWWNVAVAMMEYDPKKLWDGLNHIQSNHPSPLKEYSQDVATAYRVRILSSLPAMLSGPPPQPYWALLNFNSVQEWEQFCQANPPSSYAAVHDQAAGGTEKATLTQVVAFLESSSGVPVRT